MLSGSETVEQAYALGKLLRVGLDSHQATLPEEVSGALDAYRLPLSAIRDADVVVVLGDVPVVERAPVVDLWIKSARRNGARILDDASRRRRRGGARRPRLERAPAAAAARPSRSSRRSSASPAARAAAPSTCPRRRTAAASPTPGPRAATTKAEAVESIGLLVVSGDEAAADENVRALAEQAEATIVISMFGGLSAGWADLILPGTSYLERDGTFVNLEGRLQRLRRTVEPPCPDELEWISQLAARFDVDVAPYAAAVFAEVSEQVYGGTSLRRGRRAGAAARLPRGAGARRAREPLPAAGARRRSAARSGSSRTSRSSPAPPSSASPSSSSSGRSPSSSSRPTTRGGARSRPATSSPSARTAARSRCRPASTAGSAPGIARVAIEHAERSRRHRRGREGRGGGDRVTRTSPGGSRSSRR